MRHFNHVHQNGFTLLELVLVLFLIGLLASAGLLFTEGQQDEAYFNETQRRQTIIRDAIIRSTERVVNGQPELAGFAVDNGRLPYCLAELVASPFDLTQSASSPGFYTSPCDASLELLKPTVTASGVRTGWYGPYIQINPEQDGVRRFRDGYQNGNNPTDPNYGWVVTLAESGTEYSAPITAPINPPAEIFYLYSEGYDLSTTADDYPSLGNDDLIVADDWLAPSSFNIRFVNTSAASAISNLDNSLDWTVTLAKSSGDPNAYTSDFTFSPPGSSIPARGIYEYTVAVSSSTAFSDKLPAGYYIVSTRCDDSTATSPASCPEMTSSPYTVMVLPRQQFGPIRWNIEP
ncbi:prepilin-type N-terminal cleavage/methylation domain-containing protein [Methylophaga thiooxydans]|uniref:Prepilin-type N-terminal cleavage/methylation domain protein n=1 Tax=Methylophaga thiooxydans DMS010 TaxID=637616 RepID=C0N7U9_9GAMM|nr:prepilin-type N-terminal cleavage/methylation domain-containing protein [Methylophaga thiooxydans]EEF79539.1 prepilin-type N-terminal cleavage/methylation domain protein [Methylophaga thiooxydans DMS010]